MFRNLNAKMKCVFYIRFTCLDFEGKRRGRGTLGGGHGGGGGEGLGRQVSTETKINTELENNKDCTIVRVSRKLSLFILL